MSELTPCNFCTLERLKREYPEHALWIEPGEYNMIDVYLMDAKGKGRRLVAFSALTTRCAC